MLAVTATVAATVATMTFRSSHAERIVRNIFETNMPSVRFVSQDDADEGGDAIVVRVRNTKMFEKILRHGEVGLAESFMDGDWTTNDLEGFLTALIGEETRMRRDVRRKSPLLALAKLRTRFARNENDVARAKRNISHHYDIGNDLYERMLGIHMQYTCAYFHRPDLSLDDAQMAKMELIAKKLDLRPGMRVLDIGCGFGSMASHLARTYGVRVVGVTLSIKQKQYADTHFAHENVEIRLQDYRHVDDGPFDRIFSVGMVEHIGRDRFPEYFRHCDRLLRDDGIMLIHTIGMNTRGKWNKHQFINKYIFPGGEIPQAKHLLPPSTSSFQIEDWQNFGLSYARTLRAWRANIGDWTGLEAYDTRFRLMWTYYLECCAAAFAMKRCVLWQVVYTKFGHRRDTDCHHIRQHVAKKKRGPFLRC